MLFFTLLVLSPQLTRIGFCGTLLAEAKNDLTITEHQASMSHMTSSTPTVQLQKSESPLVTPEPNVPQAPPSLVQSLSNEESTAIPPQSPQKSNPPKNSIQIDPEQIRKHEELMSASNPIIQSASQSWKPHWNLLSSSRDVLLSKSKAMAQFASGAVSYLRETVNERFALQMKESDRQWWFTANRMRLNFRDIPLINRYYKAMSAFDKSPTAVVRADARLLELIQQPDYRILMEKQLNKFMQLILSETEFKRRTAILNDQALRLVIFKDWDSILKKIAADTGIKLEEVFHFGNRLGGKDMFPSFKKYDHKTDMKQLELDAKQQPKLEAAFKNYLTPEIYNSRVNLLKTLSEMKNTEAIPWDEIPAWLAQGLDVKRMLKIIDYTEEFLKVSAATPEIPHFDLNDPSTREIYHLFTDSNHFLIPWPSSLEDNEIFLHDAAKKQSYHTIRAQLIWDHHLPPKVKTVKFANDDDAVKFASDDDAVKFASDDDAVKFATNGESTSGKSGNIDKKRPWWQKVFVTARKYVAKFLKNLTILHF